MGYKDVIEPLGIKIRRQTAEEIGKVMDGLIETAYCGTFRVEDLEKYIKVMKRLGFDSKLKKKFGIGSEKDAVAQSGLSDPTREIFEKEDAPREGRGFKSHQQGIPSEKPMTEKKFGAD